jgi:hypothetical protein
MEAALAALSDRFNLDGYRKARGSGWRSPAKRPGAAPAVAGSADELLQYDPQPLGCPLLKLTAELASKARGVARRGAAATRHLLLQTLRARADCHAPLRRLRAPQPPSCSSRRAPWRRPMRRSCC